MIKSKDGRKGGLLVGKTDKDGGVGIPAEVVGGEKVILGGGEIIINEEAATKNCEKLSEINESTGGRHIDCELQKNANTGKMNKGGSVGKFIPSELQKGIEVEKEHTETFERLLDGEITINEAITETAKDHLSENPRYYSELLKIESRMAAGGKSEKRDRNSYITENIKTFMPPNELSMIGSGMRGEEEDYFRGVLDELEGIISTMPKTYETENIPANEKMVYLHYFNSGSDWYIIEKDSEKEQLQAFGYVILNGDTENAEMGYIDIEQLKKMNVELDLHFHPIKLSVITKENNTLPNEEKIKQQSLLETKEMLVDYIGKHSFNEFFTALQGNSFGAFPVDYKNTIGLIGLKKEYGIEANKILAKKFYTNNRVIANSNRKKNKAEADKIRSDIFIDNITQMAYQAEEKMQQDIADSDLKAAKDNFSLSDKLIEEKYPKLSKSEVTKIAEIVDAILIKEPSAISELDRSILEKYEGLGSQTQTGIIDKGLLHQFYTPYIIVKKMFDLAAHYGFNGGNILEPSMGTGRFFKYAPKGSKLIGFDPDKKNIEIAKILYPRSENYQEAFETAFLEKPRLNKMAKKTWLPEIDLCIGNPPYGEYIGYYKSFMPTIFKRFEFLFIYLGLKTLKKDGLLIFIVSQNFMNNGAMYNGMKEKILELGTFVDAIRMPNGIFSSTDVGTDIVIFRKK